MIKINQKTNETTLIMEIEGRLDTMTAPVFEAALKDAVDGVTELILDFAGLEYVTSAGLRVLLFAQKVMKRQGRMVIRNVGETIKEVFNVTGFAGIMTIV